MQHFVIFLKEIRPCSDRFIQKLHVYEKLCLLRKLFCPLKIPFVETAQKKSQILVDLFSCRPLRRRLYYKQEIQVRAINAPVKLL